MVAWTSASSSTKAFEFHTINFSLVRGRGELLPQQSTAVASGKNRLCIDSRRQWPPVESDTLSDSSRCSHPPGTACFRCKVRSKDSCCRAGFFRLGALVFWTMWSFVLGTVLQRKSGSIPALLYLLDTCGTWPKRAQNTDQVRCLHRKVRKQIVFKTQKEKYLKSYSGDQL